MCLGDTGSAGLFPHPHRVRVTEGVFFAGHAFEAEVCGDMSFVTLGEFLGLLKKVQQFFIGDAEILGILCSMLALVGQPSLRGRDACMVFGAKGASRRNCRQKYRKTSFSPLFVFC